MPGWLVVNADDLGITRGATNGIVRAHREGVVTSASLAVTTDAYEHAVEACSRNCPTLGLGLHFTLTSGKPVSPSREVPQLVGEHGHFPWRFSTLFAAASLQKRAGLLDQVEAELEAQIVRLQRDGIAPDHIDGERHVHLIPGIFERVVAAARRHHVPFVRLGREAGRRLSSVREWPALVGGGNFVKSSLLSALSERNRGLLTNGVRSADYFASYLYSGRPELFLSRLLDGSPWSGITEVMVHPGLPEESAGVALGNAELERYLVSEQRRTELRACLDASGRLGAWKPTTFRKLAEGGVVS